MRFAQLQHDSKVLHSRTVRQHHDQLSINETLRNSMLFSRLRKDSTCCSVMPVLPLASILLSASWRHLHDMDTASPLTKFHKHRDDDRDSSIWLPLSCELSFGARACSHCLEMYLQPCSPAR